MCLKEYRSYLEKQIEDLERDIEEENSKKLGTYSK